VGDHRPLDRRMMVRRGGASAAIRTVGAVGAVIREQPLTMPRPPGSYNELGIVPYLTMWK
jgi:hypothetical protein